MPFLLPWHTLAYYVIICPAHCLPIGYDASRCDEKMNIFFIVVESKPNPSRIVILITTSQSNRSRIAIVIAALVTFESWSYLYRRQSQRPVQPFPVLTSTPGHITATPWLSDLTHYVNISCRTSRVSRQCTTIITRTLMCFLTCLNNTKTYSLILQCSNATSQSPVKNAATTSPRRSFLGTGH